MKTAVLVMLCAIGGAFAGQASLLPQSCIDAKAASKACVTKALAAAGVNFDIAKAKACLTQCPGAQSAARPQLDAYFGCMKGAVGGKMADCIKPKVSFVPVEVSAGGGGASAGAKTAGRAARSTGFLARASCSPAASACVQGVVGDWFGKQDQLKKALCDAHTQCASSGQSAQCKTDKAALVKAVCACKDALKADVAAAKTSCSPKLPAGLPPKSKSDEEEKCGDSAENSSEGVSEGISGSISASSESSESSESSSESKSKGTSKSASTDNSGGKSKGTSKGASKSTSASSGSDENAVGKAKGGASKSTSTDNSGGKSKGTSKGASKSTSASSGSDENATGAAKSSEEGGVKWCDASSSLEDVSSDE